MVKNEFLMNNSKNIDIWILRKEQNLVISEFYMYVPSKVKIDWEMTVKNHRWPPRYLVFDVSTSDRGEFPRIIVIALFLYLSGLVLFLKYSTWKNETTSKSLWNQILIN